MDDISNWFGYLAGEGEFVVEMGWRPAVIRRVQVN